MIHSHRYPRSRYAARWWIIAGSFAAALLAVTGTAYAVVTARTTVDCDKPTSSPVDDQGRFRVTLDCVGPAPALSASVSPSASPVTTTPVPPTSPPATTTAPAPSTSAPSVNCLAQLAACGFPYALNTGPVGPLTVSTRTQYATAGETISGVDIRGCVEVRAAGVTFRNVRIAAPCFWAVRSFAAGAVFEDVEITCADTPGSNGYSNGAGGSVTLRRADIHGCENGLNVPGATTVVDSWIHDLYDGGDAHTDGAQFNQGAAGVRFEHNTIDARGNTTSAIIMWDEGDPQNRDVTITRNLMAGGAYTLYCGRFGTAVNVAITGNRFGPYTYGYANGCASGGEVWSGNVRDSDGRALAAT